MTAPICSQEPTATTDIKMKGYKKGQQQKKNSYTPSEMTVNGQRLMTNNK